MMRAALQHGWTRLLFAAGSIMVAASCRPGLEELAPEELEQAKVAEAAAGSSAAWSYDPTSMYDQKGLFGSRGFSIQSPNEAIDPFSGNVVLHHVDLTLPGPGGFDLTVQRVYNSKIHRNYAARTSADPGRVSAGMSFAGPSPLGVGWTMHFGRLTNASTALPNDALTYARTLENADGSIEMFYQVAGEVDGALDCDAPPCLISKSFKTLDWDASGPIVLSPDGKLTRFGHSTWDGFALLYYATEIRDTHGNTIQIEYHGNTIPGIDLVSEAFRHYPSRVTDALGRVVEFGYEIVQQPNMVKLTSISVNGRAYRYSYTTSSPYAPSHAFLATAQPPEGAPWRYAYSGLSNGTCANLSRRWCELSTMTTINGGTVTYYYGDFTWYVGTRPMPVRAVTTRITGGRAATSGSWSYLYNRGSSYLGDEHTSIRRPDGSREIHTYFGVGNGAYFPPGEAWRSGLLAATRIVTSAGIVLERTEMTWDSALLSSEIDGDPWLGFDAGVHLPRLATKTIRRENNVYTTQVSHFTHLTKPRCSIETGDAGTRYWLYDYTGMNGPGAYAGHYFASLPVLEVLSGEPISPDICSGSGELTVDADVEATRRTYSDHGKITRLWKNGVITDYEYHADGSLWREIMHRQGTESSPADSVCTSYLAYSFAQPTRIEQGGNSQCSSALAWETRTINPDGTVASVSDGAGRTTSFRYDGVGRVLEVNPPGGRSRIVVTYDGGPTAPSTLRRVTQGSYWFEQRFDGHGRETETRNSAGIIVNRSFDALGRVTYRSYPHNGYNNGDSLFYDALSRLTQIRHADYTARNYAYSPDVFRVTVTDELGRMTVQRYKGFASPDDLRLAWVALPGQPQPVQDQYTYTASGRLIGLEYEGLQQSLAYNFRKRVTHENTGSDLRYFGYDAAGNLRCRSTTIWCNDGSWNSSAASYIDVSYVLDRMNRTTGLDYRGSSTPDVSFVYGHGDGLLERMLDGVGTHSFDYDAAGQLSATEVEIEGVNYRTSYEHDDRGNVTAITYPSGRRVEFRYDSGNRLTSVPGFLSTISYHPSGLASSISYANTRSMSLTLDARRRPDRMTVPGVFGHDYDFNGVGNLTRLGGTLNARTLALGYDALDRLTSASGPWGTLEYQYDDLGNRTLERRNGVELQMTTLQGGGMPVNPDPAELGYRYDAEGNVTGRARAPDGHIFSYDLEDRLVRVERITPFMTVVREAEYVYDGNGRKAMQIVGSGCGNARLFHYDHAGALIAESSTTGIMLKEYVVAGGRTMAEIELSPLEALPSDLDAGQVELGESADVAFDVVNHSNREVVLASDGSWSSHFRLASGDGAVLLPGQVTTLLARFAPLTEGPLEGTIRFCAGGVPLQITMRGVGVQPIPIVPLQLALDADVDPATVEGGAFVVHGAVGGAASVSAWYADGQLVLSPAKRLISGDELTITSSGLFDRSGQPIPARVRRARVPTQPSGGYVYGSQSISRPSGYSFLDAPAGDLDADGDADLVLVRLVAATGDIEDQVWLNDGYGIFTERGAHPRAQGSGAMTLLLDVNGDGSIDRLAWDRGMQGRIFLSLSSSAGVLSPAGVTHVPGISSLSAVVSGDFDADGDQDVLLFGGAPGGVLVVPLLNDGAGAFSAGAAVSLSQGSALAAGDLDGDGDLDAYVTGYGFGAQSWRLLNSGAAVFSAVAEGVNGQDLTLGHFDGDALLDGLFLGTQGGTSLKLGARQPDGTVRFADVPGGAQLSVTSPVALADLDGDGDLDAAARDYLSTRLLNNTGGNLVLGYLVYAGHLAAADLDSDGDVDLVTTTNNGLLLQMNQ